MKLQDDDGIWVDSQEGLNTLVGNYFSNHFTPREEVECDFIFLEPVESIVSQAQNVELEKEFIEAEFKRAIKQMHLDKAPGQDGFNPAIYQKCWEIVGGGIFQNGVQWLNRGEFPVDQNDTNVELIPLVDTPQTVKDLRPI